ncbi:hypothetical protein EDB95_1483 [Dinghuibacter silviterrae]|uniref:Uncharacterized protein n=2 Tax=Dinghuibacter silviterrae TaxID=1539049 RepID=A0A4R8DRM6_9BACT|nr:hypothetical protein EDB95_1483 [Dinghuibacter silviterrae]
MLTVISNRNNSFLARQTNKLYLGSKTMDDITKILGVGNQIEITVSRDIKERLAALTIEYAASFEDHKLYEPFLYPAIRLMSRYPQFSFSLGFSLVPIVREYEARIGKEICKEALYAAMSVCAVEKNDVLQYRVYLDKMLQQRELYDKSMPELIDLITSGGVFGPLEKGVNSVFDENMVIVRLKNFFGTLTFTDTCRGLHSLQRHFINQIVEYRLLHASLKYEDCVDVIFEKCYTLIQTLCTLVETALREKLKSTSQLGGLINRLPEPYTSSITRLDLSKRFRLGIFLNSMRILSLCCRKWTCVTTNTTL